MKQVACVSRVKQELQVVSSSLWNVKNQVKLNTDELSKLKDILERIERGEAAQGGGERQVDETGNGCRWRGERKLSDGISHGQAG